MSPAPEIKEREFAHNICRALDENAASLPASTVEKLAAARLVALARKKPEALAARAFVPVLAHAGGEPSMSPRSAPRERRVSPFVRMLRAWPVIALVVGVAAIAYWENLQRSAELADIDAAMLNDELPLNAYLDHGFNAYLSRAR
ncbi:uncharacterized protein DUF3619 [Trinickia symbiotica]|uniref:DUF3619 domain-containing protein n=1 Tax=Trinickia symbiotica TaxID=863227 RepID=A0A2N7X300_9BURK|nr:DUF3619 family protein [Trinickia symbiotica]PMS35994.1 DUF3619 domain-containing protein [Trinickia symbiotica]PPK45648.1 uncharacterized protein DUF3619 [Trinickia symbiotica]